MMFSTQLFAIWCALLLKEKIICSKFQPQSLRSAAVSKVCVAVGSVLPGLIFAIKSMRDNDSSGKEHFSLFQNYLTGGQSVLEIGFGEGANYQYYPSNLKLYALDPFINKFTIDKSKYLKKSITWHTLEARAEDIPFPDETFDVVVSTLVFCSVIDPEKSLLEVIRVLKNGGVFLCVEHIHADDGSLLGMEQNILDPLQQLVANGCHLTRHTDVLLHRYASKSEGIRFSQILQSKIVSFDTEWPISRQIFFAARK